MSCEGESPLHCKVFDDSLFKALLRRPCRHAGGALLATRASGCFLLGEALRYEEKDNRLSL